MKRLFLVLCVVLAPFTVRAQINKKDIARIIKTLSSDKMMGRYAFSSHIWDAANFITSEFADIGLQPLKGQDDYLQRFPIYSISIKSAQITLNGNVLADNKYFATVNSPDINWTQDDVLVKQIQKGDNFRTELRKYFRLEENAVIFVDPSFADIFHRFKPFFSRPNRTFNKTGGTNKVFILAPKADRFHIKLKKNISQTELANVAGRIVGNRKNEIVIFSAHYDHIGILKPVRGDSIANGANDDASGTAAVIELARYFAQQEKPERTLIFVTFTAEEVGGYGSRYFSKQFNPDHIIAMFNIEMIGKPSARGPHSAWITGFDKSSFAQILQENSKDINFTFFPCPYPNKNLFYRSDNATFARLGVPAHSISTTQIVKDPDYHQVSDEFSTLSLTTITNTIKAIAHAAKGIISGEDTPTRVDPKTVR